MIRSAGALRRIPRRVLAALLIALCALVRPVAADEAGGAKALGPSTNLPLPRFVSLKRDQVYMRRGPGSDHPIEWVYVRRHLPVEIINEYDLWREVRDADGTEGWISANMLSGERFVIVRAQAGKDPRSRLYSRPDRKAPVIALAEPGVIAELKHCPDAWCQIEAGERTGWVERASIWGVLDNERVE